MCLPFEAFAQREGEIYDYILLESRDTLRVKRRIGDWFFGVNFGGSFNYYVDSIFLPRYPQLPISDSINPEFPLTGGIGIGYGFGAVTEFNPNDTQYGFGIRFGLDSRIFTNTSNPIPIQEDNKLTIEKITTETQLNYYIISPFVRYNYMGEFYLTAGMDIELFNSITKVHKISFQNPDPIEDTRKLTNYLNNVRTRLSLSLGVGYDMNVIDINDGNRLFLNPYALVSYGTSIFDKDASSIRTPDFNVGTFRLGVAVKYVRDTRAYDTLYIDTNNFENPSVLITAQVDQGISYSGFQKQELLESTEIKASEINQSEQIKEEPVLAKEMAKDTLAMKIAKKKAEEKLKKQDVSFNKLKEFSYPTSASEDLTPEMKDYLDAVAQFLKQNPNAKVYFTGHSDNTGNPDIQRTRSNNRAQKALRYLLGKQIPKSRILATGNGSTKPKATNDTDEGKRKNRRLQIEIK
jgi:outer membrane protein OmpA-like peptidoglycan-associated protein